jgi:hypothetical protein
MELLPLKGSMEVVVHITGKVRGLQKVVLSDLEPVAVA